MTEYPARTADTMSEAIAQSSPSGHVSERSAQLCEYCIARAALAAATPTPQEGRPS